MRSILFIFLVCMGATAHAQCFCGTYMIGNSKFTVQALPDQDQQQGLFNVVYSKGNKTGTMASLSEDPKFEFVFDEHEGDIYRGTFYFTRAWKGKPLEGYYIRASDKKRIKVKFIKEG